MWRYIVYLLTWLSGDPADIGRESARAAASISAARATMATDTTPDPQPAPGGCCSDCAGMGTIVHGDGHRTPCPCPATCKCKTPRAPMPEASPTLGSPARP